MKQKKKHIEIEGEVIQALPNAMFKVRLVNRLVILAHVSGVWNVEFYKRIQF